MRPKGYNGKILWVDLSDRSYRVEVPDESFWRRYGGGGLAATRLLLEHTEAGIDPLGPENLLIFASSVVAGADAPGLARFTTAGKSPLTGGIGETRTEGPWGPAFKVCGVDILVVTGLSSTPVMIEVGPSVRSPVPDQTTEGLAWPFTMPMTCGVARWERPQTGSSDGWETMSTWPRSGRRGRTSSGSRPWSRTGHFRCREWGWGR